MYVCMCATCVSSPHRGQKRVLYTLELLLPSGCWEPNTDPPKELLTAEPFLPLARIDFFLVGEAVLGFVDKGRGRENNQA